jgi:hypothetical protein
MSSGIDVREDLSVTSRCLSKRHKVRTLGRYNRPPTMNSSPTPIVSERVQGTLLGVAGLCVIGLAIFAWHLKTEFLRHAQRAEGTVTALKAGTSHVLIEFNDHAGNRIEFPGNGWISHRVGERVPVVYSEDNPIPTAQLDEPGAIWGWTGSLAFIGSVLSLTGAYTFGKRRGMNNAVS